MEKSNIVGIMEALRGEIKNIVKEAVSEVLAERNTPVEVVKEAPKTDKVVDIKEVKVDKENPHAVAQKAVNKAEKVEEVVEDEVDEESARREELKAMKYNEIKALVKSLGGKAVGNTESLIEQIIELEANVEGEEDTTPVEETTQEVVEETTEEAGDESDEDNEEEAEAFREFLADLDKEALLEIGKGLELEAPKKWKKDTFIELLIADTDSLYEVLEELGYYDEEDGDKEDLVNNVDEEDTEEDVEEDEVEATLADELSEKSLEELANICSENGLSTKGKKQALVDRIVKAVEAGEISLDGTESEEGEESDEWYTQEELEDMSLEDLKEIAEMNEIEIPKKKVKGKAVIDKVALIEAILALGESEDEEEGESSSDEEEGSEDQFELSDERVAKEEEIEEGIRAQYKAKKLKDANIKKFLEKYNEGNPKYKAPTKDEALEKYIEIKVGLVDDEGEVHNAEDCYIRDGEYFCCGSKLSEMDGEPFCNVCGVMYEM